MIVCDPNKQLQRLKAIGGLYVWRTFSTNAPDHNPADSLDNLGPGKLPELGKGLGKSIREFKKAMSGEDNAPNTDVKKEPDSQGTIEMKKEAIQLDTVEAKKEIIPQDTPDKKG